MSQFNISDTTGLKSKTLLRKSLGHIQEYIKKDNTIVSTRVDFIFMNCIGSLRLFNFFNQICHIFRSFFKSKEKKKSSTVLIFNLVNQKFIKTKQGEKNE